MKEEPKIGVPSIERFLPTHKKCEYTGYFLDNKPHGIGVEVNDVGKRISEFKNGKIDGLSIFSLF